jgi:hypothetical protein
MTFTGLAHNALLSLADQRVIPLPGPLGPPVWARASLASCGTKPNCFDRRTEPQVPNAILPKNIGSPRFMRGRAGTMFIGGRWGC